MVASPPITAADPRTVVLIFFFFLVNSSKVTTPAGTPPPGEIGLISAVRPSSFNFFFLKIGCATTTSEVPDRATDSGTMPIASP